MRKWMLAVVMTFLLCAAPSRSVWAGEPVKLALKFREGQVLRYTYQESLTYTPPTKFVGAPTWQLDVKVDYHIKINGVAEDQTATVRLVFDRITITKDGKTLADLTVFPRQGDSVSATIKANGETNFYKNFYITINRSGQLEYRISNGGGAIATNTTASNGSETFILAADLDEGQGVIKLGVPPTRTLESPDYAKLCEFKVDLTPRKLFELLTMPTVALEEGQSFSIPVKYLGTSRMTYQGQADEGGFQGASVQTELTPWTDASTDPSIIQPVVTGSLNYLIDGTGKLARVKGKLHTEMLIPGIGPQIGETRIDLALRK